MPKNKISDLRDHLFETLEALKDKESPMELDRAEAICRVSQTIINSAKVEVEYAQTVGELLGQTYEPDSKFFEGSKQLLPAGKPNGAAHQ